MWQAIPPVQPIEIECAALGNPTWRFKISSLDLIHLGVRVMSLVCRSHAGASFQQVGASLTCHWLPAATRRRRSALPRLSLRRGAGQAALSLPCNERPCGFNTQGAPKWGARRNSGRWLLGVHGGVPDPGKCDDRAPWHARRCRGPRGGLPPPFFSETVKTRAGLLGQRGCGSSCSAATTKAQTGQRGKGWCSSAPARCESMGLNAAGAPVSVGPGPCLI